MFRFYAMLCQGSGCVPKFGDILLILYSEPLSTYLHIPIASISSQYVICELNVCRARCRIHKLLKVFEQLLHILIHHFLKSMPSICNESEMHCDKEYLTSEIRPCGE